MISYSDEKYGKVLDFSVFFVIIIIMKQKKHFVCSKCGAVSPMWVGKCPECQSWGTLIEQSDSPAATARETTDIPQPLHITEIGQDEHCIIKCKDDELNNFFGKGIVSGSVILLAGEPGIGKSSFLLLLAHNLTQEKILYFSGEETLYQLKRRAVRLGVTHNNILLSDCSDVDDIISVCRREKPAIVFVDSIQMMKKRDLDMSFTSTNQMKFCTDALVDFAKQTNTAVVLIGHVTKSGDIAGPKVIEHLVDVVVYFENDIKNNFRILRSVKNRYGNIDDILFFSMSETGLKIVNNNFEMIHSQNFYKTAAGKCKCIVTEGPKLLLIEVESLLTPSVFAAPRRFAEGIDPARLNRITAILNKHLGENLNNYDVYATITNGIRVKDVAVDFAIAAAIYSSKNNIPIDGRSCFIGELSLSGDVVNVKKLENRIAELEKFGIDRIYVPADCDIQKKFPNAIGVDNIRKMKDFLK